MMMIIIIAVSHQASRNSNLDSLPVCSICQEKFVYFSILCLSVPMILTSFCDPPARQKWHPQWRKKKGILVEITEKLH